MNNVTKWSVVAIVVSLTVILLLGALGKEVTEDVTPLTPEQGALTLEQEERLYNAYMTGCVEASEEENARESCNCMFEYMKAEVGVAGMLDATPSLVLNAAVHCVDEF
jgi:hypothetical protein